MQNAGFVFGPSAAIRFMSGSSSWEADAVIHKSFAPSANILLR